MTAAAAALVKQLDPVPGALNEIARHVRRHCAQAARTNGEAIDAALTEQLDQLQARTWELYKAVCALALAARP